MAAQLTNTGKISTASLWVGDLQSNVTETILFGIFNQIGAVTSIRVCRDKKTRKSLRYAYVNYACVKHAEQALDTFNYTKINGKPCRIMWCQRDPKLRQSNKGSIFVKNLNKSIDNKMFHDIFSKYGNILSCKLVLNPKPEEQSYNSGYGYIQFSDDTSAQNAIQQLNGTIIHDEKICVELFEPREERVKKQPYTNVYVKYIPKSFDENQLKKLFETETNGKITKMQFWKREFGISACLNFETHEQAKFAVEKMNDKTMVDPIDNNSQQLYVARAEKRKIRKQEFRKQNRRTKAIGRTPDGANLYIKNLPKKMITADLQQLFTRFGKIRSVQVMKNSRGKSKGFGFVAFETKDAAVNAMNQMSNVLIDGKPIYISFAQKMAVRKKYLDEVIGNQFNSNHENVSNTMNVLRHQIDNILMPNLKQINNQITFAQLNQWNVANKPYWLMLHEQKRTITQQIKTYRLQYKQCELSLIQLQQENVSNQLLASPLNNNNDNVIVTAAVFQPEGKSENKDDVDAQFEEKKLMNGTEVDENVDRGKLKFRLWLNDVVKLPSYLKLFEDNEYDDVSMIEFFDVDTIQNELGIKKLHGQMILKRVNEFKESMNVFDEIIESDVVLKPYKQIFVENSILTMVHLMNDIKTKEDVVKILNIDGNREVEITSILNVILNAK